MKTSISTDALSAAIEAVSAKSPLVHNITNFVVMNNTANALLAIAHHPLWPIGPTKCKYHTLLFHIH